MKLFPLAAVFVCLAAAVAVRADSIPDGYIRSGHGSDPKKSGSCGVEFRIKLNGHGGGITNCVNTSGQDWIGLDYFALVPARAPVKCITFFSVCEIIFITPVFVEVTMFGGAVITSGSTATNCNPTPPSPIPSSCFFINLNNGGTTGPDDHGGWIPFPSGFNKGFVTVDAITTPEPGSILLVAIGLGILSARRRVKSLC